MTNWLGGEEVLEENYSKYIMEIWSIGRFAVLLPVLTVHIC